MELEKLVLADLESMDLKGVKILDLSFVDEDVNVKFEITDTQIEFVAKDTDDFTTTSLARNGNVYTEDKILSKCDGWVKFVGTMIMPVVKKHQEALENQDSTSDEQNNQEEKKDIEALIEEIEATDDKPATDDVVENEIETSEKTEEITPLEEAENKGHKEGYKAARKKNADEMRKLKRKYRFILFFVIVILLAAFAVVWIEFGPGFNF